MSGGAVILAVVVGAVYLVSLYLWPWAPCRWCAGRGTNRGSTRRRFGECRFCRGSRRRQRIGSRAIHRAVRSSAAYRRNRGQP